MRAALIIALTVAAAAVHYAHGSPAGPSAYLFCAVVLAAFAIYSRGLHAKNYWLSLTGLVEAWFLFDYCIYGTAVSVLARSKTPLAASIDDAYARTYFVGALAFAAFAIGAHFGFTRPHLPRLRRPRPSRWVYLLFTAAGVLSIAVLLHDPESRQQLLYSHVGLAPREGMGRYTALLFMLPSTAVGLWYLSKHIHARFVTIAALFLIAAIHLGCGRRLMWAGTMLMIFHLLKVRGIFTLRTRHLAAALPIVLLVSVWMESSKNTGWTVAADSINIQSLTDGSRIFDMVDNSAGRFDTTAALITDRDTEPYYYGKTFLLATLQVLPVSAGLPRSLGVREELGELIYGSFGAGLASQEASFVGELYANFSYAGVLAGFLLVGFFAAWLDARCHHSRQPLIAIGYGLCLFRAVHQLATASTSWFPLTFLAFLPWLCAWAVSRFPRRSLA